MKRGMSRIAVVWLATLVGTGVSFAWGPSSDWGYAAVQECPDTETLCAVVSCPAVGQPSFELMLYEHGRGTGEEVVMEIDGRPVPLELPERGENGLYRWDAAQSEELIGLLGRGRAAGIIVDPGSIPAPISLRGSGRAIRGLLARCGAAQPASSAPSRAVGNRSALTGLSDNTDCADATSEGTVVSRRLDRTKREIETFVFRDPQYGESTINVSLPEAMPRSQKAALHRQIMDMVKPGAQLRLGVQGCGAGARIEVVSSIHPI